jgi:flagellar hook-basal body complex protein FliE
MNIEAISSVIPTTGTGYVTQATAVGDADKVSFGNELTGAVDGLRALQSESNTLALAAVTGNLDDIHAASIASERASATLELTAAIRDKGVAAFNEIMRMQA